MSSDADRQEVFLAIDQASLLHSAHDDVVDRPDGELVVEDIPEEVHDAAVGAMTMEDGAKDDLSEPVLGDADVEEDLVILSLRTEGGLQCPFGLVDLRVDELAADVVISGQAAERLEAGHAVEGESYALTRSPPSRGRGLGVNIRIQIADNHGSHACPLHFQQ